MERPSGPDAGCDTERQDPELQPSPVRSWKVGADAPSPPGPEAARALLAALDREADGTEVTVLRVALADVSAPTRNAVSASVAAEASVVDTSTGTPAGPERPEVFDALLVPDRDPMVNATALSVMTGVAGVSLASYAVGGPGADAGAGEDPLPAIDDLADDVVRADHDPPGATRTDTDTKVGDDGPDDDPGGAGDDLDLAAAMESVASAAADPEEASGDAGEGGPGSGAGAAAGSDDWVAPLPPHEDERPFRTGTPAAIAEWFGGPPVAPDATGEDGDGAAGGRPDHPTDAPEDTDAPDATEDTDAPVATDAPDATEDTDPPDPPDPPDAPAGPADAEGAVSDADPERLVAALVDADLDDDDRAALREALGLAPPDALRERIDELTGEVATLRAAVRADAGGGDALATELAAVTAEVAGLRRRTAELAASVAAVEDRLADDEPEDPVAALRARQEALEVATGEALAALTARTDGLEGDVRSLAAFRERIEAAVERRD